MDGSTIITTGTVGHTLTFQFQYQFNGWYIGNNWRFIDYAWTPNQFWRYPANRWAFDIGLIIFLLLYVGHD
jgi:hypothetical protein